MSPRSKKSLERRIKEDKNFTVKRSGKIIIENGKLINNIVKPTGK